MIRREQDAELINKLSNQDHIRPFINRRNEIMDWSPIMRGIVVLSNGEDAVMAFEQTADRDWQCTTIYGSTCRGKRAVQTGLEMKAWMIPRYADMVFGSIPNGFKHALWFYHQLGGRRVAQVVSGDTIYEAQPDETLFVVRAED